MTIAQERAYSLERLLRPRSVAVVGATDRDGSYGAQALISLQAIGYPGEVWGVNPGRSEVRLVDVDHAGRVGGGGRAARRMIHEGRIGTLGPGS